MTSAENHVEHQQEHYNKKTIRKYRLLHDSCERDKLNILFRRTESHGLAQINTSCYLLKSLENSRSKTNLLKYSRTSIASLKSTHKNLPSA